MATVFSRWWRRWRRRAATNWPPRSDSAAQVKQFDLCCTVARSLLHLWEHIGDIAICYANAEAANRDLNWTATRSLDDMCAGTFLPICSLLLDGSIVFPILPVGFCYVYVFRLVALADDEPQRIQLRVIRDLLLLITTTVVIAPFPFYAYIKLERCKIVLLCSMLTRRTLRLDSTPRDNSTTTDKNTKNTVLSLTPDDSQSE